MHALLVNPELDKVVVVYDISFGEALLQQGWHRAVPAVNYIPFSEGLLVEDVGVVEALKVPDGF